MNKFQKIIHRRISGLILDAESAGEPQHNPTAGYLREKYIIQFLKDMTPWGISLTSGILFNAKDTTSPQIDLIAVNNSALPALALYESLTMVPVEAALIAAEIKSTLTTCALNQLTKQNNIIRDFQVVAYGTNFIVPTIIVALDSELSKNRVIEWMQAKEKEKLINGNTPMCCVIGKFYLIRQGDNIMQWDANGNYQETLSFIADFWGALTNLKQIREIRTKPTPIGYPHPLEVYLKGLVQ